MKLIDILVEELPKRGGWPEGANFIAQDEGRATWSFINEPAKDEDDEWMENSETSYHKLLGHLPEASDYDTAIITREQYESALASKNEGWIEWGGGLIPISANTFVDVKFNNGDVRLGKIAGEYSWEHVWEDSNIIAYRLHKPQEAVRPEADYKADLNECIDQDSVPVWNGTDLPPVGCFCEVEDVHGMLVYGHGESGEVIAHVENTAVIRMSYGLGCFEAGFLRPLRTEAERKRDEVRKAMYAAMDIVDGDIADAIYDAIAAGEIPGVNLED